MSANAAIVEAALADWATRDRASALRLFVPEARTLSASARIALGHALRESAWMGSDARVNEAKSAWWLEELALSERGQPRHPLTSFLLKETVLLDFTQLSRAFARLRAMAPHDPSKDALQALGGLEEVLWFGPATLDATACMTRARAALVDVLDRSGRFGMASDGKATAGSDACAHAAALRAAPACDGWTAARRAQALGWIEARSGHGSAGAGARWREVWAVWRAVQAVRWRGSKDTQSGGKHGA